MAHVAAFVDAAADERARQRVNQVLGGPVMTIMMDLVPELRGYPKEQALEMTLRDCALLHRCFQAFRNERPRFKALLVDRRDRLVENDNTPLACGRTVNQVVAMIVRSAAKRHFRMRLDWRRTWGEGGAPRSRLEQPRDVGLRGLLGWMTGRREAARNQPRRPAPSDQLYSAIRQYLLHDWQVPIIPQYARMSPAEVRALGSRILDFRDEVQMAAYLNGGGELPASSELPPEPAVAAESVAAPMLPPSPAEPVEGGAALPGAPLIPALGRARLGEVLSQDGRSIRMETMAQVLVRPEIKAALGYPNQDSLVLASRTLARTGAATVRRLVVDFGLSAEQMAAMLTAAALVLPPEVFERMFGRQGELAVMTALLQRARAAGLGPDSTPAELAAHMRELFARFRR